MKHLFFGLTILLGFSCSSTIEEKKTGGGNHQTFIITGERIDGPANIRDTVNGKVLFTLNDNVLVETSPANKGWQEVGLYVSLTEKELDNFKINPNTALHSIGGQIVGQTKDTVDLWSTNDKKKTGFVGAYSQIDNIKKHTIPEYALSVEVVKGNLTLGTLKPYLKAFGFKENGIDKKLTYKQYYIYESTMVDPSPQDRITLLFDKDNKLLGAIHSRPLSITTFSTYELIRGHAMTIFANLGKNEIERIIENRISFYNSVD